MAEEVKVLAQDAPTHEVLEAAWDHLEKFERDNAAPEKPAAQAAGKTDEELDREALERHEDEGGRGRDASGRFARKEPTDAEPAAPREAQPGVVSPPPAPGAPTAFRAPQAWRPVERVELEKASPVIQQAVMRREQEMDARLRQAAPHRQFVDEWTKTVQPFEPMIRAAGQTPLTAVRNMFNVAQALSTQPEYSKAQIIAGLMRSYGVTPQALGQVLTVGQQPQYQPQPQQYQDPRVDQLYAEMQQFQGAQEAGIAAAEDAALDEFAKTHPWLDDISDVMSDMLRVSAERGESLDYEQAYQRALTLRPDLMEIERQRAEETARANKNAPTPGSRTANLGVGGSSRVTARPKKAPATTREAAELAWETLAGDANRV